MPLLRGGRFGLSVSAALSPWPANTLEKAKLVEGALKPINPMGEKLPCPEKEQKEFTQAAKHASECPSRAQ